MSLPFEVIDLTHTLSAETPTWTGDCGFEYELLFDYDPADPVKFRIHKIHMSAGTGTHLDAPLHCFANATDIATIPLHDLIAPCVVIDVSYCEPDYVVCVQDIEDFEARYGAIPQECFVIIHTGWSRFWDEPIRYRNDLVFPSISLEAAQYFLDRKIVGLGIDTLSPDTATSGYPVHHLLLGAGKYLVENVANANKLPAVGAYSFVLPVKIKEGTEAPVRMIGVTIRQ
jgi:kynurenine formamidase